MTRFPFTSFPKSWFKVAYSDELKKGEVKAIKYFGRELVIFRGQDGQAHVTDAHCPHLGAHLGVQGRVEGNNIVCPFHGWKFSGNGDCVNIPYCQKIPAKARLSAWQTCEVNGVIFAYFDKDKGAPRFDLPVLEEYGSKGWTGYYKLHWVVRTHIQEIAENAVDLAHFAALHDYREIPKPSAISTLAHQLHVSVDATRRILGQVTVSNLDITYHGMGCVIGRVNSPTVNLIAFLTPTPIDDEHLNINMSVMFKKKFPGFNWALARIILTTIKKEFDRDVAIWERKGYFERPVLCAADGPIMKVRRWANQFYEPAQASI